MSLEQIIVGVIVLGAFVFAVVWLRRAVTKKNACGNCACGKKFK